MEDRLEKEMHLVYMAPCDCRKLNLAAASLDVVTSRACLERVPPDVIQDVFNESYRVLKRGVWRATWSTTPIIGSMWTSVLAE